MTTLNQNWPVIGTSVAFGVDPNATPYPVFTDITTRVRTCSVNRGRQYELDQFQSGSMSLTARNEDETFSPGNTASAYYNSVKPMRRITQIAAWPVAGNILNDTNSNVAPAYAGSIASVLTNVTATDGNFEDGTVGHWHGSSGHSGTALIANSTTYAEQGTHSLKVTTVADTGTNGFSGWNQGAYLSFPTIPGRVVTVSAYVYIPASSGVAGVRMDVFAVAGPVTTSVVGSWHRLSFTFTALNPQTVVYLTVTGAVPAAGLSFYVDAVQVEFGSTLNAYTSTGPTIYPVYAGYVERWPEKWNDAGFYGYLDLECVDAFNALAQYTMDSAIVMDFLQDAPVSFWQLNEASGATGAGNSGTDNTTGSLSFTNVGAGTGTYAFGNAGPIEVNCLTMTPTSSTVGKILQTAQLPANLGSQGGYPMTFELVFLSTGSATVLLEALDPWKNWFSIMLVTGGYIAAQIDGTSLAQTPLAYNDGTWHHVAVTLSRSGSVLTTTIFVDGAQVVQGTTSAGWGVISAVALAVGGRLTANQTQALFNGSICLVAVYRSVLSSARIASHATAVSTAFSGDGSGARINRVLAWIGWNGQTSIETGSSVMGMATSYSGQSALTVMQDVELSENGAFFVGPDGALTFQGRNHRNLSTSSVLTFGENAAGGEIPYLDDIEFGYDLQLVYNTISIKRAGGVTSTVSDATSISNYFTRKLDRNSYVSTDSEATDASNFLLNKYKQPMERVTQLAVDIGANPSVAGQVLGLDISDRVTVTRRPSAGSVQSGDYFIESIKHDIKFDQSNAQWIVTFMMSPVTPFTFWISDDPVNSISDSTTIFGY